MNVIRIRINRPNYLINKLKKVFNPFVIVDGIETVLSFDNHLGKGNFTIISVDNDFLNIFFTGVLHEELCIETSHSNSVVMNYIFSLAGQLKVQVNEFNIESKGNRAEQLIYKQNFNDVDRLIWPIHEYTTFNLLKVFEETSLYKDITYSKISTQEINKILNENYKDLAIYHIDKKNIDENLIWIKSDHVGLKRNNELMQKLKSLFWFHTHTLQELLKLK